MLLFLKHGSLCPEQGSVYWGGNACYSTNKSTSARSFKSPLKRVLVPVLPGTIRLWNLAISGKDFALNSQQLKPTNISQFLIIFASPAKNGEACSWNFSLL